MQDFYVRMAIVADIKRKPEFEAKMRFHAFDDLRLNKRVSFLSYDALVKQYEMEQENNHLNLSFRTCNYLYCYAYIFNHSETIQQMIVVRQFWSNRNT